ncbi:MAG: hypothetical protein M1812_005990 [Candelaria pacifica]|nr:MAG: hypothetical protein M1812_005990 [Candelaria pacifica]
MAAPNPPKAILFDIGGVVVASPFQAILDYETANRIPPGWINFSISRSAPDGTFQQLERGEILLDEVFFEGFWRDLNDGKRWIEFWDREHFKKESKKEDGRIRVPPLPQVDAKWLFWEMMRVSRTTDPDLYPALLKLKASNRFLIAALSNTVIFPPNHPYSKPREPNLYSRFDVFISSAHVGLRKPDPMIYELAIREMDRFWRGKGRGGIEGGDVLFLDDIGGNLKIARESGMRTLKVELGRGREAVRVLERVTGLDLGGEDMGKLKL